MFFVSACCRFSSSLSEDFLLSQLRVHRSDLFQERVAFRNAVNISDFSVHSGRHRCTLLGYRSTDHVPHRTDERCLPTADRAYHREGHVVVVFNNAVHIHRLKRLSNAESTHTCLLLRTALGHFVIGWQVACCPKTHFLDFIRGVLTKKKGIESAHGSFRLLSLVVYIGIDSARCVGRTQNDLWCGMFRCDYITRPL